MNNQNKINKLQKQKAYAWAKFYQSSQELHHHILYHHNTIQQVREEVRDLPNHLVVEIEKMVIELKKKLECPICLDIIEEGKLKITGCGHKYCEDCLSQIDKCAICRRNIRK